MPQDWRSPTLKEWCASPQARQLTAAEEASRAAWIVKGTEARSVLLEVASPQVGAYLDRIAGADETIKPAARSSLAMAIVDMALDAWATSGRSARGFLDDLTKAFCEGVSAHFDLRRQKEKDFWVSDDAWLEEHFSVQGLRESLDGTVFASASLWEQLAKAGDAINDLVQHGLSIVPSVVASLRGHGIERLSREDAEGEAAAALRKTAWRFSPTEGQRFHQLAVPSLKNHLLSRIRTARGHTEDLAKKLAHFARVKSRLWVGLQREPTNEEVLSAIDKWGDRKKENFRCFLEVRDPVPQNWDGAIETLPDYRDEDAEAIALRRQRVERVRAAMLALTDDERMVLTCRYSHGLTKAETARRTDKSPAVVARLEARAIRKLRGLCQELAFDD